MKHKIAKQLKEAGYPQTPEGASQFDYIDNNGVLGNLDADESYYIPTTDELISEVMLFVSDMSLDMKSRHDTGQQWVVVARNENKAESGDTLAEALAKLWLKFKLA